MIIKPLSLNVVSLDREVLLVLEANQNTLSVTLNIEVMFGVQHLEIPIMDAICSGSIAQQ